MKKIVSLIALLALACSMLIGCNFGGNNPNKDGGTPAGDENKDQPTEAVFLGYYSDCEDISISFVDYDLTSGKQDFVFKFTNKGDDNFYFNIDVSVDKKVDGEWKEVNTLEYVCVNVPSEHMFSTYHRIVEAGSETVLSTYDSRVRNRQSLDLLEAGIYRISFTNVVAHEENYVPWTGYLLLELKNKKM